MSGIVGYLVMCDTSHALMETQVTALMPAVVYGYQDVAQRERDRAQAHARLDADIDPGFTYTYWIGEVRRVPAD